MLVRKWCSGLVVVLLGVLPCLAQAAGVPALVLSVSGDVSREAIGRSGTSVEPYSRILEGDRVKLGGTSRLVLVYPSNGRQEVWSGSGLILSEGGESRLMEGGAQLQVKALPPQIAAQMGKMPIADASGKVGMVRMRAMVGDPGALEKLRARYADLRSNAEPDDRSPEIFLFAGLFEMAEYDLLLKELDQLKQKFPEDVAVQALSKLYDQAVASAQQARR